MHDDFPVEQAFSDFLQALELTETENTRVTKAIEAISDHLRQVFELDGDAIFLQGSYASRTTIRALPRKGEEYDVDLVVRCALPGQSSTESLNTLEEALRASGHHVNKLTGKKKKSCVQLSYAPDRQDRGFHVDVVPARLLSGGAEIEVPRRDEAWKPSSPRRFAQWCDAQGDEFNKIVRILKRWRDVNIIAKKRVKSILFQVLIRRNLVTGSNIQYSLTHTLMALDKYLQSQSAVPEISNPVLTENLTENWTLSDFQVFRRTLGEAARLAQAALEETDPPQKLTLWRNLLGTDFPADTELTTEAFEEVGQVKTLSDSGWRDSSGSRPPLLIRAYRVEQRTRQIHLRSGPRTERQRFRLPHHSGQTVRAGNFLYFDLVDPLDAQGATLFWQIRNTGHHALVEAQCPRGEFELPNPELAKAQQNPANDTVRVEQTKFHGTHTVQAFLIKDDVCLVKSEPFYIGVDAGRRTIEYQVNAQHGSIA